MTKHGMHKTRTYSIWRQLKLRTCNPSHVKWEYYGGRGITLYEPWKEFTNFFADMGECPEGLSLDRIDNEGIYEPSNCRWATPKEQSANRRPIVRRSEFSRLIKALNEAHKSNHDHRICREFLDA